ncbi:MAG: nucleotidyltransferase domain-containing protein [Clostridiales bacterium]|nr:nucleotidyltransferase domain-containing protein [Clostridiales bacterium]
MDQRKINECINKFVERVISEYNPQKIILFGSYARGDYHENCDIDIAVVVDGFSDSFIDGEVNLYRIRREIISDIEPILIDKNEDKSGFLEHILSYGKIVYDATNPNA